MTTTAQVINETRLLFYSSQRDTVNRLNTTLDASTTSVVLDFDAPGLAIGSVLSIGLEEMLVWSWTTGSKTATVERGYNGSAAAAHTAGDMVWVNPKITDFAILGQLNNELRALSAPGSGLYDASSVELTFNPSIAGYDLTGVTDLEGVLGVRVEVPGPEKWWTDLRRNEYVVQRAMSTSEFASGVALKMLRPAWSGRAVRVTYKAPFGTLSSLSDNVETTTGLPATAVDVLSIGAAIRLAGSREIARNFFEAQGSSRRADEVPPGATNQSLAGLRVLYQRRVNEEAARLARQYGV